MVRRDKSCSRGRATTSRTRECLWMCPSNQELSGPKWHINLQFLVVQTGNWWNMNIRWVVLKNTWGKLSRGSRPTWKGPGASSKATPPPWISILLAENHMGFGWNLVFFHYIDMILTWSCHKKILNHFDITLRHHSRAMWHCSLTKCCDFWCALLRVKEVKGQI